MSNDIIDSISNRSRESILKALDQAYKREDFQYIKTEDPVVHIKTTDDAISEITQKMTDNKFVVHDVSKDEIINTINEISKQYNAKSLIYGQSLSIDVNLIEAESKFLYNQSIDDIRSTVFDSDFSVIDVDYGIASHGVVLVASNKDKPRMLSLAPNLCIMLLDKSRIKKSLVEGLYAIKNTHERLPTNILFIAGPSRTSDIELITVFGVHGSQKVHLIMY